MARFNLQLDGDLKEKARTEMKGLGLKSLAGFVRMAIIKFPFTGGERRWTDQDMKDFARHFAERTPPPPGSFQSMDYQLKTELFKFQSNVNG